MLTILHCKITSNVKLFTTKSQRFKTQKAEYFYVLQPKKDYQGSKNLLTEFRWIGPYNHENLLPNNNDLVPKVGTNKTQMLRCMQLRRFTPQQPPTDVQISPQEWKSDPEVSNKHDDLCARACECDYERPIFNAKDDKTTPAGPAEIAVPLDLAPDEMWSTPESSQECSPETFPSVDGLFDGTDTYQILAIQKKIYVTIRSLIATTAKDIGCLTQHQ